MALGSQSRHLAADRPSAHVQSGRREFRLHPLHVQTVLEERGSELYRGMSIRG